MFVSALLMMLILAAAAAVVLYVIYPHRGFAVPRAPWLGEAMQRVVDGVGSALGLRPSGPPRS